MRIGINAANLGAERFELTIGGAAGGDIQLVLGQSGGLTGRYEQDSGRIRLREIAGPQLSILALALPLAHGIVRLDAPSIVHGLLVDAELGGGRPFAGRVTAASLGAHLSFERGPLLLRAGLSARGVVFEETEPSAQRAELESLELEALRIELDGEALLHVERLSLRGVRLSTGRGGLGLACDAARAEALSLEHGGRSLRLEQLTFPAGLTLAGEVLRWPELALERLEVTAPGLASRPQARPAPAPAPAPATTSAALELPVLDHLQGLLALDLFLDVRIPILPDRRATHSLRVPVSDGAINFKQLERCLAGLEDALLDFEVNDEGLILELDPIPGVTLDNVTLVTWPLAGHEHGLAKTRQQIRLRRLLDYRLSPKLAGDGSSSRSERPSALRRLHVGNIDTVLALHGPVTQPLPGLGVLRLGAPGAPAVRELRLGGQLEHSPGAAPSATELRVDARELSLGASLADGRGRRIELQSLSIARLDALRVGLLGLQPQSVSLAAEGLRSGEVELRGVIGRPKV